MLLYFYLRGGFLVVDLESVEIGWLERFGSFHNTSLVARWGL